MCLHLSIMGRMIQQRISDKIQCSSVTHIWSLFPAMQANLKTKDSVCLFPILNQTAWLVAPLLFFHNFQQMQTNISIGRMPPVTANLLKSDLWFNLVEELSPEIYLSVPFISWRCTYERCTYM